MSNPSPTTPSRPPDISAAEWCGFAAQVIVTARKAPALQGIPTHALDHMHGVLRGDIVDARLDAVEKELLLIRAAIAAGAILSNRIADGRHVRTLDDIVAGMIKTVQGA